MTSPRILIVEDEHALAVALAATVRQAGAASDLAPSAAQARDRLRADGKYDAMILDIGLPDENGLEFLASLPRSQRPVTIVITAHGEIDNTISARKLGVVEFLPKPLDFAEFNQTLERLLRPAKGKTDEAESAAPDSGAFIGAAPSMRPVFQQIAHACATADPVLVRGETGTGKSHAARLIQRNSGRNPETSSTLVAGPATGTDHLANALAEAAGGVLILENVAQLSSEAQAELVRRIETTGAEKFPRLVATSSFDLRDAAANGTLRSDLFYRLQVLEVRLPTLRKRIEDLPALVSFFAGQLMPNRTVSIENNALVQLSLHDWPGNLRELRNVVSYALTVSSGAAVIDKSHLPDYLGLSSPSRRGKDSSEALMRTLEAWLDEQFSQTESPVYRDLAQSLETMLIRRLLKRYGGKLAPLARDLQANRTTLRRKLRDG